MNTIHLYRVAPDGSKTRWRFVLDDARTIVEETLDPEEAVPVATEAAPGGGRVITSVSPEERKILGFFVDSTPCWFENCEELRAKYKAEIENLGSECPACQKGAVIRKYQDIIRRVAPSA